MATHFNMGGRAIMSLNFDADRHKWGPRKCAEAITVIHNEMKTLLDDFAKLAHNDPAKFHGLSTYLGSSYTTTSRFPVQTCFEQKVMISLRKIVFSEWICEYKFFSSASVCHEYLRRQQGNGDGNAIHVLFYLHPEDHRVLASANFDQKAIYINLQWFADPKRSGHSLSNMLSYLRPEDLLELLNFSLTPVLLHECLHLAQTWIQDVYIHRLQLPQTINDATTQRWPGEDYIRCYGEYECRMLPRLAAQGFSHACFGVDRNHKIIPKHLTICNAESIKRAILSTWLSSKRPLLNFFPQGDLIEPRIKPRCLVKLRITQDSVRVERRKKDTIILPGAATKLSDPPRDVTGIDGTTTAEEDEIDIGRLKI